MKPEFWRNALRMITAARSADFPTSHHLARAMALEIGHAPSGVKRAKAQELFDRLTTLYGLDSIEVDTTENSSWNGLDQWQHDARLGTSLVTCSKNRTENLERALASWLPHNQIDEIIIVDWGSDYPVAETLPKHLLNDPRVRIVRAEDQSRWILTYAYNLGFRCASCEKVLKADADIIIGGDFFERNVLRPGEYITGDWQAADPGQEHINGFFYTWRSDLLGCNGFNEFITTYGWDDTDLYDRLSRRSLERRTVDTETIWHQDHDDAARLGEGDPVCNDALAAIQMSPLQAIRRNKHLSEFMPPWTYARPWVRFRLRNAAPNYLEVEQDGAAPNLVPEEVFQEADQKAIRELAAWRYGPQVWELDWESLAAGLANARDGEFDPTHVGRTKSTAAIASANLTNRRARLFIDAQHGLGNRLRAIASAAVVARQTNRELVIVWQPDAHCECGLHDLFHYEGEVVEASDKPRAKDDTLRVYNYMEGEAGAEKGAIIDTATEADIYVRSAYVLNNPLTNWDEENSFLRQLTPVERVQELVDSVRTPNDVAAHVRMVGGRAYEHLPEEASTNWTEEAHNQIDYWRQQSHYSNFLKRIDRLMEQGEVDTVFVAADKPETYDVFVTRYGERVAYLPREVYDRSARQLQYALADAILLGRAPRMLGSTWSSFSELARRLARNGLQVEMSGDDF